MNDFFEFAGKSEQCTANHIAVYCGLYNLCQISKSKVIEVSSVFNFNVKVNRRGTFLSVLSDLEEWGFIKIVQKAINSHKPLIVNVEHFVRKTRAKSNKFQLCTSAKVDEVQHCTSAKVDDDNSLKISEIENENKNNIPDEIKFVKKRKNSENKVAKTSRIDQVEKNVDSEKVQYAEVEELEYAGTASEVPIEVKEVEVEVVQTEKVQKPKKRNSRPTKEKEKKESIVRKIQLITEEKKPGYYWSAKDGFHASRIVKQINLKSQVIRGQDATEEEILNVYKKILDRIENTFLGKAWDVPLIASQLNKIWDLIFNKKTIIDNNSGRELSSTEIATMLIKKERGLL